MNELELIMQAATTLKDVTREINDAVKHLDALSVSLNALIALYMERKTNKA